MRTNTLRQRSDCTWINYGLFFCLTTTRLDVQALGFLMVFPYIVHLFKTIWTWFVCAFRPASCQS